VLGDQEIKPEDQLTLSNFEMTCKLIMCAAINRKYTPKRDLDE
jgi:hypothetical protein